jgi:hypothetical protein
MPPGAERAEPRLPLRLQAVDDQLELALHRNLQGSTGATDVCVRIAGTSSRAPKLPITKNS